MHKYIQRSNNYKFDLSEIQIFILKTEFALINKNMINDKFDIFKTNYEKIIHGDI